MGIIAILVEIGFGIWGAIGKPWYWYPINIAALFVAGIAINTSFIQWVTRCHSVFLVKGTKGLFDIMGISLITFIYWAAAYGLSRIVFADHFRIIIFFGICAALSLIVAFSNGKRQ